MIIKTLGTLDIISAILFWIHAFFHIIPEPIVVAIALYLLVKGLLFLISKDFMSALDVISAAIIFLSLSFTIHPIIVMLVTVFLLQKGIFSWVV